MSKQVNFFADSVDSATLHRRLIQSLPSLAVWDERRTKIPSTELDALVSRLPPCKKLFLAPAWARDGFRQWLRETSSVSLRHLPAIEYLPSRMLDLRENRLGVGRLYWAFVGGVTKAQARQVAGLFDWVRRHSTPLPFH